MWHMHYLCHGLTKEVYLTWCSAPAGWSSCTPRDSRVSRLGTALSPLSASLVGRWVIWVCPGRWLYRRVWWRGPAPVRAEEGLKFVPRLWIQSGRPSGWSCDLPAKTVFPLLQYSTTIGQHVYWTRHYCVDLSVRQRSFQRNQLKKSFFFRQKVEKPTEH